MLGYCCLEMLNNFWTTHPRLIWHGIAPCALEHAVQLSSFPGFTVMSFLTLSSFNTVCHQKLLPCCRRKRFFSTYKASKTHFEWVLGSISHWKSWTGVHLSLTWEMIKPWRLGQGMDCGLHPMVLVPSSPPSRLLTHLKSPELLALI